MDACAYILLRDNPAGTLTDYKETMHDRREIPVSACPASIEDLLESSRRSTEGHEDLSHFILLLERLDEHAAIYQDKRREAARAAKAAKRPPTRFELLAGITRAHPGSTLAWCRVDTDNDFEYHGERFTIDKAVTQYQPTDTEEGPYYDMDEVLVVRTAENELYFFDQRLTPIGGDMILGPL